MLSTALQILAFALALLGVLGATVATLLPNWKVSVNVWGGVMTPVSRMQGLWVDCVWFSSGVFSCTVKSSLLSLPPCLQATRAAMVLCCLLATFGLCLASLGLKCTRWGGSRRAKGHTAIAAGGCFVLASALGLVPASWYTNEVIAAFLATDSSRYQPGGALCVTFLSAGFLLAAGVIFCLSCPGKRTGRTDPPSPADPEPPAARPEDRRRRGPPPKRTAWNTTVRLQRPPEPERDRKGRMSPFRPPHKDLKDSYSLQEYV
ncbi:claudin-20-like [Pungitius pungitius]|uniref:claudin-20-like n=1 Tax=Pungitius pungitius TaxID=134920 RepID=UPI002E12B11C